MPKLIDFGEGYILQNEISKRYNDDIAELIRIVEENKDNEEIQREYAILNEDVPELIKKLFIVSKAWHLAASTMGYPSDVVDDKGKVNYDVIEDFIKKKFAVITFKGIIYIYKNTAYRDNEGEIENEIIKILRRYGVTERKKIQSITTELLYRIGKTTLVDDYPFNNLKDMVSLKNGVLWIGDSKRLLLPNSPVYGFTYNIPVEYNPSAKCPRISRFLSEITDNDEDIEVLIEIPTICLMSERYPYSYMLVGSGANGKSTYLNLLVRFLGRENVSNLALQDLNNRFRLYRLVGKLANICGDLPEKALSDTGVFKMLTGGDPVTVEKKFKDPFEYYFNGVMVYSANKLPGVRDMTDAFWRRWNLVKFPYKFKENPKLLDELTTPEELSGFLNLMLERVDRIREKGPTVSRSMHELKQEWLRRANTVYAFVNDAIERFGKGVMSNDELYSAYRRYCDENDMVPVAKKTFSQEFERLVPYTTRDRRRYKGRVSRVWIGVRIKDEYLDLVGFKGEEEKRESKEQTLDSYEETKESEEEVIGGAEEVVEKSETAETETETEEPEVLEWDVASMVEDVESIESKHAVVLSIIRDLSPKYKSGVSIKKIFKAAAEKGITDKEVAGIIDKLVEYGKIYRIKKDRYRVVE